MEENNPKFMSAEINEISAALSAFQGSVVQPEPNKNVKVNTRTGSGYNFKYAELSVCVKAAAPALKEHGLSVTQIMSDNKLITMLTHKSGQWFKSELPLPASPVQNADYQSFGSALTYLKRYSFCAILGIAAEADDDANLACGNKVELISRKPEPVSQPTFTEAQLKQAVAEMNAVTDEQGYQNVWAKWYHDCPALCEKTTAFYKSTCDKRRNLNSKNAK